MLFFVRCLFFYETTIFMTDSYFYYILPRHHIKIFILLWVEYSGGGGPFWAECSGGGGPLLAECSGGGGPL